MTNLERTLGARLQRLVLVPVAIVSLLTGAAVLTVSWVSTSQAFDRALLDDAYAIAAHVGTDANGRLVLNLTARELDTALFDHEERLYVKVAGPQATLVAGEARLQPVPTGAGPWAFGRQMLDGVAVRAVTLERPGLQPFTVTVAQTTDARTLWLLKLAGFTLLPPAVLLALLAWWLGRAIREEVTPLARLQRAVEQRDAGDLSPLDARAPSREVAGLARALNDLMARVDDGVKAQREFAGNVAHELRTPLAGIRALASYGLAHDDPALWRAQLEAIAGSEVRATRKVDQLLALAYADEARAGVRLGTVALEDVVRDAVLRHLTMADRAGVELAASGVEGPVPVHGHAELIDGVLDNLIHNALRHGRPAGGTRGLVTIDVEGQGDTVRVAVSDNGPGVAPERRRGLLERWSRERDERSGEGTGLGLSIAARYAALMGGRLLLDEAPSGGLKAVLELRRPG